MLKQALLHIAKAPFMGKVIGIAFRYFSRAIPVKKLYNSKDIVAFYHPKPSYKNHIVIVPKRAIANLQQLASEEFQEYFVMLLRTVKKDLCSISGISGFFCADFERRQAAGGFPGTLSHVHEP